MLKVEAVSERIPKSVAMKYLSIKNNVADSILRKHLGNLEKQKSVNIYNIDKDRLDLRDLLKEIQYCESEFHPTAQIYLGREISKRNILLRARLKKGKNIRQVQTAPPLPHQTERLPQIEVPSQLVFTEPKDGATALSFNAPEGGLGPRSAYIQTAGKQRRPSIALTEKSYGGSTSLNSIAKRKSNGVNPSLPSRSLTNLARDTKDMFEPINTRQHHLSSIFQRANTFSLLRDMNTVYEIDDVFEKKENIIVEECSNIQDRPSSSGSVEDDTDSETEELKALMNSKAKSRRQPIDVRLQNFYSKVNKIKQRDLEEPPEQLKKKLRRKWILITKGIEAALADSSDEDDG